MRKRFVAVFFTGILSGILLFSGMVYSLRFTEEVADAQGSNTWQVEYLGEGGADVFIEDVEAWVTTLSAECDLEPSSQLDIYFYRCP